MGQSRNTGQDNALVVYGNPESFKKLIKSHGQLCKVKQAMPCPCVANNAGSSDIHCTLCRGQGYVYNYQRRFLVTEENSPRDDTGFMLYPFYIPVIEVSKVERVISTVQGGIEEITVTGFEGSIIYTDNSTADLKKYEKIRTNYYFDGWTQITGDTLIVDSTNGLMWPTETIFDAEYQSSNPLNAEADIVQVDRIWNTETDVEIAASDYELVGNTIKTKKPIVSGQMKAAYYYADLTQVITNDIRTQDNNEVWTHDLESGMVQMAFYPWWNIAKGDIIVLTAGAAFRNETLSYTGGSDVTQLVEIEVFELNDVIFDSSGNKFYRDTDYVLLGRRYIHWITDNRPTRNGVITVRYGYKPAFIVFEDNPNFNTLENKQYPKIVYAKSWTKTSKDDIRKLMDVDIIP